MTQLQVIQNILGLGGIFLLLVFTIGTKKYMKKVARRHHV